MEVRGVRGSIEFDGEWITITKKWFGEPDRVQRLTVRSITGTKLKPATRLFHGYVQLLMPGSLPTGEKSGLALGGRPPHEDPNSLSIPHKANDSAAKLVAAVEEARVRLSP